MHEVYALPRHITLPDGRIFKVVYMQLCRQERHPRYRYRCHLDCAQYTQPRDDFDFNIYFHHSLFNTALADRENMIALYAMGQAAVWLEKNRCRTRWSTKTVEIHCTGKPPEVNELNWRSILQA